MLFHWNLRTRESFQVSRTQLSIPADVNKSVVSIVSTRVLISNSSSYFTNPLVTVSNTSITIGIAVIFMFHSFFQFLTKVQLFISLFAFLQFYPVVCWDGKVQNSGNPIFLLTSTKPGRMDEIIIIIIIIIIWRDMAKT